MSLIDELSGAASKRNRRERNEDTKPEETGTDKQSTPSIGTPVGVRGLARTGLPRNRGSESAAKMVQTAKDVFKTSTSGFTYDAFTVGQDVNPALDVTSVIITSTHPDYPKIVAWHAVIVEASSRYGNKIPPYTTSFEGRSLSIMRFSSDFITPEYIKIVEKEVLRRYKDHNSIRAGEMVIPSECKLDDLDHVYPFLLECTTACDTSLSYLSKNRAVLCVTAFSDKTNLELSTNFSHAQLIDITGRPVRSDVVTVFREVSRGTRENKQDFHTEGSNVALAESSAFFNVDWALSNRSVYRKRRDDDFEPNYAVRCILTSIRSEYPASPELVLLMLMNNITALTHMEAWRENFKIRSTPAGETDLFDLGALNYDANLEDDKSGYGERIDTKSSKFSSRNLDDLIDRLFRPELIFSVDVPEGGPESWFMQIFSDAAGGSETAKKIILQAASNLTDGYFEDHFDPKDDSIFIDTNQFVHLGYFTDQNGERQDIRYIDTIAVANLVGHNDPSVIRKWTDTFTKTDYPVEDRMAARAELLRSLTDDNVTFTGRARRLTFSNAFLTAMDKGLDDAKYSVDVITGNARDREASRRGYVSYLDEAGFSRSRLASTGRDSSRSSWLSRSDRGRRY